MNAGAAVGVERHRLTGVTNPLLNKLREKYVAFYEGRFGSSRGKGFYSEADWRRIGFATTLIPDTAESVLDVGSGPGVMLNYLAATKRFSRVLGIDRVSYSRFASFFDGVEVRIGDVASLPLPDDSFDVVFCMEVLEHLAVESFASALSELRRVCKRDLIVSVPFEEPLPLPPYHKQRFDLHTLRRHFPNGTLRLLERPGARTWPWAFVHEQVS